MPELVFSVSPQQLYASAKPVYIAPTQNQLEKLQAGGDPIGVTVFPPCNANIVSTSVPMYKLSKTFRAAPLPKSWNWCKIDDNDTPLVKAKKRIMTQPQNQGMCGSCWAVSTASCISDRFIVSGKVDKNPMISPTYIMACYQNRNGCNGGNPYILVSKDIPNSSGGVVAGNCIDYDAFCTAKNTCRKGSAEGHFEADANLMNQSLPKCGCIDPDVQHDLFKVFNGQVIGDGNVDQIKQEIFQKGPVVACFHVFRNFMVGSQMKFQATAGVYLENYIYETKTDDKGATTQVATFVDPNDPDQANNSPTLDTVGGHAVVVVGWGSTTFKGKEIGYWITRNSWGGEWCNEGFWNMPFSGNDPEFSNQIAQFDKIVYINTQGQQTPDGISGMVTFDTGDIVPEKLPASGYNIADFDKGKQTYYSSKFDVEPIKPDDGGKTGPAPPGPTPPGPTPPGPTPPVKPSAPTPFYKKAWFIILMVGILIIGALAVYILLVPMRKKKLKIEQPPLTTKTTTANGIKITTIPKMKQNFTQAFLDVLD